MATAHVPTHSIAAAWYAAKAVWASEPSEVDVVAREREWQYERLGGYTDRLIDML
jgi:hypothetical protein